jgi:tetratricopeptide (TPR) repeat protein
MMKQFGIMTLSFLLMISICGFVFGQDDESRQATGLPMKIGENQGNTSKRNISGKITVHGLDPSQPKPIMFIVVYYNGLMTDRRQVTESGNYFIQGAPRENVSIGVEINGAEVKKQNLLPALIGNTLQDFDITINQGKDNTNPNGVISAKNLYQRSAENEKIFDKAIAAEKDKKPEAAINLFKQIVTNDPKDFVAWTELGTLYFRNENAAEAETAFTKSLELNPNFVLTLMNLGRFYLTEKQGEKAISVLTKATEIQPDSADAQHLLGEAYLQEKKGSKAIGYLYEALRLEPIKKAEIHLRLASLYNAAGLKDKAVEEYKQFLQKVPKYSEKDKLEKYIKENSPK